MKKSGLQPAKDCCQVAVVVYRFVGNKGMDVPVRLDTDDGDHRCCNKVGYNLTRNLGANQLVGNDPLSLMGAAIV